MKFFIPHTETSEASEQIYQALKIQVNNAFPGPLSERRIFRIEFKHQNESYEFEVGKKAKFHEVVDEVMAIFESVQTAYLVCTPSRGIDPHSPMPVIVGFSNVLRVEDFED